MNNRHSLYDNPKKLITYGVIFMLIGIVLPFIWSGRLDFAFGICFGSGVAHFGMGMHKRYNNK